MSEKYVIFFEGNEEEITKFFEFLQRKRVKAERGFNYFDPNRTDTKITIW